MHLSVASEFSRGEFLEGKQLQAAAMLELRTFSR